MRKISVIISFGKKFTVTLVLFCVPDFKLVSCEVDHFTFKVLY